jgi:Leucine-rich repeat (LRR) protein
MNLTKLQTLLVGRNKLTHLPREISQLTNLRELFLSGNELKELPEELFTLSKLETILISRNHLTSVSDNISALTNLKAFYGSYNNITRIPEGTRKIIIYAILGFFNGYFRLFINFGIFSKFLKLDMDLNFIAILFSELLIILYNRSWQLIRSGYAATWI